MCSSAFRSAPRLVVLAVLFSGCISSPIPRDEASVPPVIAKIEDLRERGRYTEALIECVDQAKVDPNTPGLPELRNKVMADIAKQRAKAAAARDKTSADLMSVEADEKKILPDTYGLRRGSRGEGGPLKTPLSQMEQMLRRPITLHLENAGLEDFILAVGDSQGINIISDSDLNADKRMTVHADKVPLAEVLDYISRNLGVAFYSGNNVIWVTRQTAPDATMPLETRIYRLRKGISNKEITSGQLAITEAITRFVPKAEGSDSYFDEKTHVLIAKNTRANLAKIEELITSLDVVPPQVLIEARFIGARVDDLRELGIDWILNSDYAVTKVDMGGAVKAPETIVTAGSGYSFAGFPKDTEGLNLTYQGVLTDPAFKAVLHALDISGKARALSVPKVTTVNNQEAKITVGEDFRWFEEYEAVSVPLSNNGNLAQYGSMIVPSGSPQTRQLGITLAVTPSVGADLSSVSLHLNPSIDQFVRYEVYETANNNASGNQVGSSNATSLIKLPIFSTRNIDTEVVVQSGETIVMGGLITTTDTKEMRKVPILGSIPLIGIPFRHEITEQKKENLLIFVTATIISERGEDLVPMATATPAPAPAAGAPAAR